MTIKLEDISPEDAEYTLSNGKTYQCRKFTLVDNVWLEKEFGVGDALETALNDPLQMMRVAFHQMPPEQQEQFKAIQIKEVDENTGESSVKSLG